MQSRENRKKELGKKITNKEQPKLNWRKEIKPEVEEIRRSVGELECQSPGRNRAHEVYFIEKNKNIILIVWHTEQDSKAIVTQVSHLLKKESDADNGKTYYLPKASLGCCPIRIKPEFLSDWFYLIISDKRP